MDYIQQENAYCDSVMSKTAGLQNQLFSEMNQFPEIKKEKPLPVLDGFTYPNDEYGVADTLIRTDKKGHKHEILNLSYYKSNHSFVQIVNYQYSPDHKYLAYLIDFTGNEIGTLFILKVGDSMDKADSLYGISYMYFWNDKNQLFYVTRELPFKFQKLYLHQPDSKLGQDILIKEESSEKGSIDLYKTADMLHFMVTRDTQAQIFYFSAKTKYKGFKPLFAERRGGFFYLFNKDEVIFMENNIISRFPVNHAEKAVEVRRFAENTSLFDLQLCGNYLVIFEEKEGSQKISRFNLKNSQEDQIQFPEKTYTISNVYKDPQNQNLLYFSYSSMVTPRILYRYNAEENKLEVKEQRILKNYKRELYQTDLIFIESADHKQIPVSLIYRKDKFTADGKNPLILRAYGAYSYSQFPGFDTYLLPMADRGFVYAVAHVRGGSEMGTQWYREGIGSGKLNSINDYIAVSEGLIQKGYTGKGLISAFGRSAGGRLIASVINQRPDLYRCAIMEVPACDGVNWLTDRKNDFFNKGEFGDPEKKEDLDFYLQYDPYQNVKKQNYPALLITGGWNDNRVAYWQPLKLAAKLRAMKTDSNILLMKTEIDAGHRGGSSADAYYLDWAFKYAFILGMYNK